MKLNKDVKSVNYCGYGIIVPEWANYAAVDQDGTFWVYSDCPADSEDCGCFHSDRTICQADLDYVFEFEDWRESLVKF